MFNKITAKQIFSLKNVFEKKKLTNFMKHF